MYTSGHKILCTFSFHFIYGFHAYTTQYSEWYRHRAAVVPPAVYSTVSSSWMYDYYYLRCFFVMLGSSIKMGKSEPLVCCVLCATRYEEFCFCAVNVMIINV